MPHYSDATYTVLQLEGIPPAVLGETYIVAVGIHTAETTFKGEYYVLTQRPAPTLHSGKWRFDQGTVPTDLLTVDLPFMIEESITLARNVLFDQITARAREIDAERIATDRFVLREPSARPFVSCQMRGLFTEQIVTMAKETECKSLNRYLCAVNQIQPVQYE